MKKKTIISMVLFIIFFIFSIIILIKNNNQKINDSITSDIILFYGDGCPHCLIVEDYINDNNVLDKINITQKEVYYDELNAQALREKASLCNLDTNSIGVPFLWDSSNCYIGDQEIINFLKSKISQ